MAPHLLLILRQSVLSALLVCTAVSCSTVSKGDGGQITKVKYYHLLPGERVITPDRAINFERRYRLYGAVSLAEQQERRGQYYNVNWKVKDRSQPVTLKFEYRQAQRGLEVFTQEITIDNVRRNNWTEFQVTGPAYTSNGQVTAWRISLLRGTDLIASQTSYLWE